MVRPTLSVVRELLGVVPELLGVVREPSGVVPEQDIASGAAMPRTVHPYPGPRPAGAESGWTPLALCRTSDPDALFVTGAAQRDAAKICQACPVRLECLADALDNQVEYGVWGGMTERQRRALLKKSPTVSSWRALLTQAREEAAS